MTTVAPGKLGHSVKAAPTGGTKAGGGAGGDQPPHHLATIARIGVALIVLVSVVVPVVLWLPLHSGVPGAVVDSPKPTAAELAERSVQSTQYLVSLATALFGVVGIIFVPKDSPFREGLTRRWRRVLGFGMVMLALSLWTGFVAHQFTLQAEVDAVVRSTLDTVLALHMIQLGQLASAVALIGSAFVFSAVLPD